MDSNRPSVGSRVWLKLTCYNNYHGAFIAFNTIGAAEHCSYSAAVLATYASVWLAKRLTKQMARTTKGIHV